MPKMTLIAKVGLALLLTLLASACGTRAHSAAHSSRSGSSAVMVKPSGAGGMGHGSAGETRMEIEVVGEASNGRDAQVVASFATGAPPMNLGGCQASIS